MDALSIALSGLTALKRGLGVSANNIANASTAGGVPDSDSPPDAPNVYRPLQVNYASQIVQGEGAGVRADVTEIKNSYSLAYDPDSAYANSEGYISVPNVDFAQEAVNLIETKALFKANVAVIKTEKEMMGALLDIVE